MAHTLKGVAGNIGAKAVYKAAALLEEACSAGHEPAASQDLLLPGVQDALIPLIQGLQRWSQAGRQGVSALSSPSLEHPSAVAADQALQGWRRALEQGDPASVDQWFEHQAAWRTHLAAGADDRFEEMEKALLNFDFEHVLAILDAVPGFFRDR